MEKKKRTKRFHFLSFLIDIIIVVLLSAIAIFVYYCYNYGMETAIEEMAYDVEAIKISVLGENKSEKIEIANIENPLNYMQKSSDASVQVSTKASIPYYYSQIDNNAKVIYNALAKNIENLKRGNYTIEFGEEFNDLLNSEDGSEKLNCSYQQALDAFIIDNPEVFYIDISKMYLMIYSKKTIIRTSYTVSIKSEDGGTYYDSSFTSKEQIDDACSKIEAIKLNLCEQLSGDTYNKIKQVHDCLVDNFQYDQSISKPNIRNIYGGLINKEVVCEGYAKTFKYILDELGIENIIVVGTGTNSNGNNESHAWNYVNLDGTWYAIDVTWDDPIVIGYGRLTDREKHRYFMKGSEAFNANHEPIGRVSNEGMAFEYPVLSVGDYN